MASPCKDRVGLRVLNFPTKFLNAFRPFALFLVFRIECMWAWENEREVLRWKVQLLNEVFEDPEVGIPLLWGRSVIITKTLNITVWKYQWLRDTDQYITLKQHVLNTREALFFPHLVKKKVNSYVLFLKILLLINGMLDKWDPTFSTDEKFEEPGTSLT